MRSMTKKGLAALAVSTLTLGMLALGNSSAHADTAAGSSDIVGVGSDTLQYMLDFGADGDYNGNTGYNAGKGSHIVSYDATPDANARAGYLNGSTSSALLALNPTIVLRAGTLPVQRPNGSGAGLNALIADGASGSTGEINFVRSSSVLSQANVTQAGTAGFSWHTVRLATESLAIATANVTNAPTLSAAQLKSIYQCLPGFTTWNGTGIGAASGDTIFPVIPQLGSGTRKTFLTDIGFAVNSDGSSTPALGNCVKTDEENNPYSLYLTSTGASQADPYLTSAVPSPDAIVPFSGARLNLYADGYFQNPNALYGATSAPSGEQLTLAPAVKLNTSGYVDNRGLYIDFRDSDVNSTSHFNGSALNWVKTLFLNPTGTPFFKSAAAQSLLLSAGVTPAYADCGVNSISASSCS
jgi:ABC-type phosphate transport system substrate-binding protein